MFETIYLNILFNRETYSEREWLHNFNFESVVIYNQILFVLGDKMIFKQN